MLGGFTCNKTIKFDKHFVLNLHYAMCQQRRFRIRNPGHGAEYLAVSFCTSASFKMAESSNGTPVIGGHIAMFSAFELSQTSSVSIAHCRIEMNIAEREQNSHREADQTRRIVGLTVRSSIHAISKARSRERMAVADKKEHRRLLKEMEHKSEEAIEDLRAHRVAQVDETNVIKLISSIRGIGCI